MKTLGTIFFFIVCALCALGAIGHFDRGEAPPASTWHRERIDGACRMLVTNDGRRIFIAEHWGEECDPVTGARSQWTIAPYTGHNAR